MPEPLSIVFGVLWGAHKIAQQEVPKRIERRIQEKIDAKLVVFEQSWRREVQKNTRLCACLAGLALTCIVLNAANMVPASLHQLVVAVVFLVPLYLSLRFVQKVYQYAPKALNLRQEIIQLIEETLDNASLAKRVVRAIYDSRTPHQFAEIIVGKVVLSFFDFAKREWKSWLILLGCYVLSWIALIILRFQL